MELVMWAILNNSGKAIEQTLKPINEEKQAIDEISVRLKLRNMTGRYKFGYFKSDGTNHFNGYIRIF